MYSGYPTNDDWKRLEKGFPVTEYHLDESKFKIDGNDLDDLRRRSDLQEWFIHIYNRFAQVRRSYILLTFYVEKRIPDDEWWISPGRKGESVQYFPHFENSHCIIKADFDYYADVFYYMIFTCWENIGHLLNVYFDLRISKPSFWKAMNAMKRVNYSLYSALSSIYFDGVFQKAKELRNNIAHNHSPNSISGSISKTSPQQITIGVGSYVPSREICDNAVGILHLLDRTFVTVSQFA